MHNISNWVHTCSGCLVFLCSLALALSLLSLRFSRVLTWLWHWPAPQAYAHRTLILTANKKKYIGTSAGILNSALHSLSNRIELPVLYSSTIRLALLSLLDNTVHITIGRYGDPESLRRSPPSRPPPLLVLQTPAVQRFGCRTGSTACRHGTLEFARSRCLPIPTWRRLVPHAARQRPLEA